jgi:glycosyltransferase involved in cell wall biosynthesis
MEPPGPVSERYRELGIEVHHLRAQGEPWWRWARRLARILGSRRYDIVEIYGLRLNLVGRALARLNRQPVVVTAQRSVDDWRRWWHVWLDRLTSRWVTVYVANSEAVARRLTDRERIAPDRITIIENGIDPALYARPGSGQIRAGLGIGADAVVITCVANLRTPKGHDVLLDAFARLRSDHPEVRLWLAGEGPLRQSIEARIEALGLASSVVLMGLRSDIPDLLAESDIFVLPSLWEGMPGSLLEAMASRLPVVASAVGGVPELVVSGETGYLVPARDPVRLAEALERLVVRPDLRQSMGRRALERASTRFALSLKVAEFEALYDSLAGRGPAGSQPPALNG